MHEPKSLNVNNARVHNLKGVSCSFPRGQLSVVTGPSGSGKSSLVFDTIWAEAQRRYTETLPAYVRQILGVWEKPDVESIDGLSPAVALDARPSGPNPRSTVGTASEIYDYVRLLFALAGVPHCPACGNHLERTPREKIITRILDLPERTKLLVTAPLGPPPAEGLDELWGQLRREGFLRVLLGEELLSLDDDPPATIGEGELAIVIDRLTVRPDRRQRLAEAVETALLKSAGRVGAVLPEGDDLMFSEQYRCERCDTAFPAFTAASFSFNNPQGACVACKGMGSVLRVDEELAFDPALSLAGGAVRPWAASLKRGTVLPEGVRDTLQALLSRSGSRSGDSMDTPFGKLSAAARGGILTLLEESTAGRRHGQRQTSWLREEACCECGGGRLHAESLAVTVGGKTIHEVSSLSLEETRVFFEALEAPEELRSVIDPIVREVIRRLDLLLELGLSYLALARAVPTLSAGEHQRLRLASQIGANLAGILYVLDEPTVGLHPAETERLLRVFRQLCERGNTVITVEHDLEVIRAADYVVDLGPSAGPQGGEVVGTGTPAEIAAQPRSLTGRYLAEELRLAVTDQPKSTRFLTIDGASAHNLKDVDARFPLNALTCVTGVSGSGKSTLVVDTLYRALARELNRSAVVPGAYRKLRCETKLRRVVAVDQSPIGRTPRSNPATYTGFFGPIRSFYAMLPLSRVRGYGANRFSFNAKGGRCEVCQGEGVKRVSIHFLPDILVPCELCGGKRFNTETLDVRYRGLSIADVLELSISEAGELFAALPKVAEQLRFLEEIGLGYLELGQRADTLSGGEAQRLKLSRELARLSRQTVYVLDEPTTGLHVHDVGLLLTALRKLVRAGNTVIVIEHNTEFIRAADYIIDMGPGGGSEGGTIVAAGTPEEVARDPHSVTGPYLL